MDTRVRILSDWDTMKIEVDRSTKKVYVDWYGNEVEIGEIGESEGEYLLNDDNVWEHWWTWMFYPHDKDWRGYTAPEGRYNLGDVLDDDLCERISDEAGDHAEDWFNGWVDGVFVGSPTKLLFGADPAPDYPMEDDE